MLPRILAWGAAGLQALVLPLLSLTLLLCPAWTPTAALAALAPAERSFLCDGEVLYAELLAGPVDAVGIPNTLAGTLPGATLVLRWRGVTLPLPRTNNAGVPSFSDGKWAWREEDPQRPLLRQLRPGGDIQEIACGPLP